MKKQITLLLGIVLFGSSALAQNTNCSGATQVCNDVSFTGNNTGAGTQELNGSNQGCLFTEHQSSWYYFQPVTSGTVALTIQTAVDYDFAIWGTGNCGSLGAPVRCSYSGQSGNTGLASSYYGQTSSFGCGFLGLFACYGTVTVSDVSETASGDAWVMPLNVVAGQTYIMLIDNFTANSTPFTLDWTFSNGATLNCNPIILPTELTEFMATYHEKENKNEVIWRTQSERFNDHFTLERSIDGSSWTMINKQEGAENSTSPIDYKHDDLDYLPGQINYYRLSQTDFDGETTVYDYIAVDNQKVARHVQKVFNTMGQEIPFDSKGLVILLYDDGTTSKIVRD